MALCLRSYLVRRKSIDNRAVADHNRYSGSAQVTINEVVIEGNLIP